MNDWTSWIANALPVVLLLGLWLFFMHRMKTEGWGKLHSKQIELLEQQLAELRQVNQLLKRLVEAR
jgi:hypothetical protein